MRVAIAGKGGTGKTTISGTLARVLARQGRQVLAIDADTTPNLAVTLGVSPENAQEMMDLPRNMMERQQQDDGTTKTVSPQTPKKSFPAIPPPAATAFGCW